MIVPAVPQHLTEEDVAALRHGDIYHVDSGLGGSFRVRFDGHDDDRFVFANVSPGWESHGPYRYTFDELREKVYDLVAENPHLRGPNP